MVSFSININKLNDKICQVKYDKSTIKIKITQKIAVDQSWRTKKSPRIFKRFTLQEASVVHDETGLQ